MPAQVQRSCLYECRVMHHRFSPKVHRFTYRIFLAAIDLDELEPLDRVGLFSVNGANLFSFREADYLPTGEPIHNGSGEPKAASGSLRSRVEGFMAGHGVDMAGGSVTLVTLPRVLGYAFNPVSFYFCRDRDGRPVGSIAEVTNTFKEMKPYFVPHTSGPSFRARVPKQFYVSPFSDVDVSFDFNLGLPGDLLGVQIDDYDQGVRTLTSVLRGTRRPFTCGMLARFFVTHPLVTVKVIASIHLHAVALWMKRVPWFAKAARAQEQRNLYRPHASVTRPTAS